MHMVSPSGFEFMVMQQKNRHMQIGIYQSIPLLTLDFTAFMRYRISRFYGFPLFLPL